MKKGSVSRQTARCLGAATRRCFAAFLLLVLLIQISPFTLREPPAADSEQGVACYLKPLQVCDDGTGFGGFLADHSWLPTLGVVPRSYPQELVYPMKPSALLLPGHPQRPLRPPRA